MWSKAGIQALQLLQGDQEELCPVLYDNLSF